MRRTWIRKLGPTISHQRSASVRLILDLLEDRALPSAASFVPNEILVQFQPGASAAARGAARGAANSALAETIQTSAMVAAGKGVLERVTLPDAIPVEAAIKIFQHNPNVQYAEPNWIYTHQAVSNDPLYSNGSLWGMYSNDSPVAVGPSGTTNSYGSQAEKAWNNGFTGSNSVYVGVIDEGIDFNHPDLAANIWTNPFDNVGDSVDDDSNGYVNDVHGWDFVNNDNSVYDGTNDDHATHVAGTIGAKGGNAQGVAGVNWNVTYISAKFLGTNGGTTANAIKAVDYLTDLKTRHGLNIVATNNSWGGGGFSQGLLDAITRGAQANILFIAAAGNGNFAGKPINNDLTANYPSNYSTTAGAGYDAVIAVAAIASNGAIASFSNYGATTVDLGAPGVGIYSTLPGNTYGSYSGTSMATPHVTGAAALYASTHPGAGAAAIKAAILASAAPTSSLAGKTVTGGRLDVNALMAPGTVNHAPTVEIDAAAGTVTNTSVALSVIGADVDAGGESSLTYTWSVSPSGAGSPTFSDNSTNTAKNTTAIFHQAGSYTFTVTISDPGGLTAISTIATAVTINPTLTGISILPGSVTLHPNDTQQFTANGTDQFGNPMAAGGVSWSNDNNLVGGIDNVTGLYSALAVGPDDHIHASAGGIIASPATVTVTAAVSNSIYIADAAWAKIVYGNNKFTDLLLTLTVKDTALLPVVGANINFTLYLNGNILATFSGITDSQGKVTFTQRKVGAGAYSGVVTALTGPSGTIWDHNLDKIIPGFTI